MTKHTHSDTGAADICLLLEGTWPYVRGGVSSWVNQLILGLPEITFSVVFIGGQKEAYSEKKYEVPANVTSIYEVYLEDSWDTSQHRQKKASSGHEENILSLHRYLHHSDMPSSEDQKKLMDSFLDGSLNLNDVLYSRSSWEAITRGFVEDSKDPSFINYFWTLRTMQTPLLMLASHVKHIPRARVLHSISTGYAGFLGALLKAEWQRPYILSEHGIYTKERKIDLSQASWIKDNPNENSMIGLNAEIGHVRRLWIRFFERIGLMAYEATDPIISLYDGNRQRQIKEGAQPEKTRVIPNGIRLDVWADALQKRPAGIPPVAGLIGRVVPIKDVKTFVRSIRGLVDRIPEAEGWIIGPEDEDPAYAEECKSLVTSLGLQGKVKFLGFQKIQDILPQLGVITLTSISEAQPLVILEGWSAGTPVVSSDVGSCRELIEGGTAEDRDLGQGGIVVPIADPQSTSEALVELLTNEERWKQAQETGLNRVKLYYTEELMLSRYRDLYVASMEKH